MHVSGKFFPEGTVLSVPSYTIHRDPEIWGNDVEVFRPERWFEQDQAGIQKTFNPFSYGPRSVRRPNLIPLARKLTTYYRACVGKNLANMELQIFMATIFRRYTFVLENPEKHVNPTHLTRSFPADRAFLSCSSTLLRGSSVNQPHAESV